MSGGTTEEGEILLSHNSTIVTSKTRSYIDIRQRLVTKILFTVIHRTDKGSCGNQELQLILTHSLQRLSADQLRWGLYVAEGRSDLHNRRSWLVIWARPTDIPQSSSRDGRSRSGAKNHANSLRNAQLSRKLQWSMQLTAGSMTLHDVPARYRQHAWRAWHSANVLLQRDYASLCFVLWGVMSASLHHIVQHSFLIIIMVIFNPGFKSGFPDKPRSGTVCH